MSNTDKTLKPLTYRATIKGATIKGAAVKGRHLNDIRARFSKLSSPVTSRYP